MNININNDIFDELELISTRERITSESVINKALENFIYLDKVNNLREKLKGIAQESGFSSEDQIIKNKL